MSTCEILNEINKLKVVDWDCDSDEIVYVKVEDTDVGKELKEQILDLEVLLAAYRSGVIAERM